MNRIVMASAVIGNILYFSDRYSNGLYQLNLDNEEYTFVDYFFDECDGGSLYFQAYVWEQKIYFIPGLADSIACFDTMTQEISYIKLPQEGIVVHGVDGIFAEKFCCQRYENVLWMMPVGYNLFLKFDLSNGQLSKVELPDSLVFTEGIFNWRTSSLYGEEMIFQPWAGTIQVRYNIVSGCFRIEEFEEGIRTYKKYLKCENYEIYVPWEMKYGLLVNNVNNNEKKYFRFDSSVEDCTCTVAFLIAKQIYLMPQFGKSIIVISIPDFSIEYIDLNKLFHKNYMSWEWIDMSETMFKYYILSSFTSDILEIDRDSGCMKLIEVKKEDSESRKRHFTRCIKNLNKKVFRQKMQGILSEGENGLEKLIIQTDLYPINGQKAYFDVGKMVYEKLKGDLK